MSHAFPIEQLEKTLGTGLDSVSFFLEGEEVQRWSNGMFSNNIRKLQPFQGNYSAICDDRGRVQGFLFLYCLTKEKFLCLLDGISLEAFMKRFQMYMVLDDIELEETDFHLSHFCGKTVDATLQENGISIPENGEILELSEGFIFRSNRFGMEGFDVLHPDANWLQGLKNITLISEKDANAVRVFHGRAKWPQDGTDKSMIHELGLNEECCAFDKGCYVGQEIINRLDVKGLINKKLLRLELINGEPATETTEVFKDEKKMGSLSSFATILDAGEKKYIGLGTIRKAGWEQGSSFQTQQGQIWQLL